VSAYFSKDSFTCASDLEICVLFCFGESTQTEKREWIADLRNDTKRIAELNDKLAANINVLQKEVDR
jgi:hypothetical protein